KVPGPSISVAYGKAVSTSSTHVEQGASVEGGKVEVDAHNVNDFEVIGTSTVTAPGLFDPTSNHKISGRNQGSGVAVAVSDTDSTSKAQVDGSLTAEEGATVKAESQNEVDTTFAETVVRNQPAAEDYLQNNMEKKLLNSGLRQQTGEFGIAAGVAVAHVVNQA